MPLAFPLQELPRCFDRRIVVHGDTQIPVWLGRTLDYRICRSRFALGKTGSPIAAHDAGEAELRNPVRPPALAGRTIEAEPSNVLRV